MKLWPQAFTNASTEEIANKAKNRVKEEVKRASKLQCRPDFLNGNVFIVSISKNFWLANLADLEYNSPLEIHFRSNHEVKAFLVY